MRWALPILLAAYAAYEAAEAFFRALNFVHGHLPGAFLGHFVMWTGVGVSLALIAAAFGLLRRRTWAWNLAAGLLGTRITLLAFQILSGLADGSWPRWPTADQIGAVATLLVACGLGIGLLVARFAAGRTRSSALDGLSSTAMARGSLGPATAGYLLVLSGFLAMGVPTGDPEHPSLLSFLSTAVIWSGAVLCFFERRWRLVRGIAVFALVLPLPGLLLSALRGGSWQGALLLGGIELVIAAMAFLTLSRTRGRRPSAVFGGEFKRAQRL